MSLEKFVQNKKKLAQQQGGSDNDEQQLGSTEGFRQFAKNKQRQELQNMQRNQAVEDVTKSPAEQVFGEDPLEDNQQNNLQFDVSPEQQDRGVDAQTSAISTEADPDNLSGGDQVAAQATELAGGFAQEVVQGTTRGFAGAASDIDRATSLSGKGVISKGLESSLDTTIGDVVFGGDTERLSLQATARESTFRDPNKESTGVMSVVDPVLGAGLVALDASGLGGAADDAAQYTLKAGDDALDGALGTVRSSADDIAQTSDETEIADIIRSQNNNLDDADIEKMSQRLVDTGSTDEVIEETGRFEGFTRADNLVRSETQQASGAVNDLVTATNKSEVDEVLARDDNNLNRLFSENVSDDVKSSIAKAESADEIQDTLRQGTVRSLKDRGFVKSTREAFPDTSSKVSGQYVPRSTDELAKKARQKIDDDIDEAINTVKTKTDDEAVATAAELMKHFSRKAENASSETAKNKALDQMSEIANDIGPKLTEQGRAVQAASIMSKQSPEGVLRTVQKQIDEFNEDVPAGSSQKELTNEQIDEFLSEARAIQEMDEGVERAKRWQQLQNKINRLTPSPWMERISQVWKAGLLTGFDTHALNIVSTAGHALSETVKDVPAAALDSMLAKWDQGSIPSPSFLEGKRTKGLAGISAKGFKEGASKGWRYLKTGFDERDIAKKLDYRNKVSFGQGKIADAFQVGTDSVFRILGAGDQPFYYGAYQRSIRDQAIAKAANKGLEGTEKKKFIEDLMENPTEEMMTYAGNDATTAVFQNSTKLGEAGRKVQDIGDGGGQFVVPFSTTPSSVASQIVNYSPAGAPLEVFQQARNGKFNQREFVESVGRSLTGTGAMALGAAMYKDDSLSLGFSANDQRKQELDRAENKKYNAIKLGDTWHDSVTFGPLGSLLTVGGYFQEELDKTGSVSSAMTNAMAGGYQSLLKHSFLEGLNSAVDAISNPQRNAKDYVARTVSSFVPSIFSDIAATTDDTQRDVRAQGLYGKIYENAIKRVPEARESLEPTVDAFGKTTEEGGIFTEMIAPTRPQESDASMVTKELRRLMEKDINVSPTQLGPSDGYESLTDEQNTRLWKETGRIIRGKLSNLMQTPKYQQLSDEKKGEVIDDFVRKSKTIGRASIAVDATQGLQGQELMKKLSELKKDNVLTGSVFEVYKGIRGGTTNPNTSGDNS